MHSSPIRISAIAFAASLLAIPTSDAAPQDVFRDVVEVTGTVVVEDGNGGEVKDESGTITLGVHVGVGTRRQDIHLVEGQWKTKVPAGSRLSFDVFDLDAATAYWMVEGEVAGTKDRFDSGGPRRDGLPIPDGGRMAVRARYVAPTWIHVVDAATDAELAHVVALRDLYRNDDDSTIGNPHWLGPNQAYPTRWQNTDLRAWDAHSPIDLRVGTTGWFVRWQENLWLHAPGYCWAGVAIDYAVGGDSTVKLVRGGTLIVAIESDPLPDTTKIVVRKRSETADETQRTGSGLESTCAEWPYTRDERMTFDALPAGEYRVSLEVGDPDGPRQEFATTNATVRVDAAAIAKLRVEHAPTTPEPVSFFATVRIDPAWGNLDFEVALSPRETTPLLPRERRRRIEREELVLDEFDSSLWKLPEQKVAPGSYVFSIDAFGIERTVNVTHDTKPIEVEIGPPVDATFHFADARSNAPLAVWNPGWRVFDPSIDWSTPRFGQAFAGILRDGPAKASFDHHDMRVLAGRIAITALLDDYEHAPVLVEVTKAQKDYIVAIRHLTGARIRLTLEGHPVAWWTNLAEDLGLVSSEALVGFKPAIRSRDPARSSVEVETGDGFSRNGRYLTVARAGEYTVTLPTLPGFEPTAPQDVAIADQELTEVVFDLVRKKK